MQLVVHSVISRYVLCARVTHSDALLCFRFERSLDLEHVLRGRTIHVLECEFSRRTHMINCRRVQECDVLQHVPSVRPCVV
jgi:hypothetical protein